MDEIRISHVEKSYTTLSTDLVIGGAKRPSRTRKVLQDVNLTFPAGKLSVLVGRSGCGKSTLLKLLAGKEAPDAGEITLPEGWHTALLSPEPYVITWTNVRQNVAMASGVGRTPEERYEHAMEYVKLVGLEDYADLSPVELSTGMKQRLGLARVLASQAEVLLMDEPLSNLDAKLRNQMRAEIIKLRERIDTTFIYVTHDQTEAMTLGDRIVIMRDGYIQQIGTPQEVFNNPRNLFVAGFIGTPQMNFFDAKLVREGEKFFVELGGYRVELDAEKEARLLAKDVQSQEVTLGVRPEHTTIGETGIAAKVDVSEMMGSSVHLHVSAEGKDVIIIVPTIDMKGHYAMGDTVHFSFDGNVAHVFSKENEKNLEW